MRARWPAVCVLTVVSALLKIKVPEWIIKSENMPWNVFEFVVIDWYNSMYEYFHMIIYSLHLIVGMRKPATTIEITDVGGYAKRWVTLMLFPSSWLLNPLQVTDLYHGSKGYLIVQITTYFLRCYSWCLVIKWNWKDRYTGSCLGCSFSY